MTNETENNNQQQVLDNTNKASEDKIVASSGDPYVCFTDDGAHSFKNLVNNLGLDGTLTGCDTTYPRSSLRNYDPTGHNQQWYMEHTDVQYYKLKNVATGLYLDGSTAGVPQPDPLRPFPYMASNSGSHYQQWIFRLVGVDTFIIRCRGNLLALDGNYTAATSQPCTGYPSPFLWEPNPAATNQKWLVTFHPASCTNPNNASAKKSFKIVTDNEEDNQESKVSQ